MNETRDLLWELVAIDSTNPDLVPGGAGEGRIADYVAHWLSEAGLEVEIDEPLPGRRSVVGIVRGSGNGRSLMLNAHLDTVGVGGMASPHEPRVEGNRLYGRGAYDMKGGLAAIMLAAAEARNRHLQGDVIVTAVADEECASMGTRSVLTRWRADGAIVTEPTGLRVCVAHKGFVWLDIETVGRAAHGSRPDLGIDAIARMGRILVGLDDLDRALHASGGHGLLGTGSVHASLIEGGQELSSYPERCLLRVERRTVPGESRDYVESQIHTLIEAAREIDPGIKARVNTTLARDPFEVAVDEPIVEIVRRQTAAQLSIEPEVVGETPWMDAALLSAAGIPTVVIGPGGEGAHAVTEWVDLLQVEQCGNILLATATEFCGR